MFRSRDDWGKRHGFDLPTQIKGAMRAMLLDTFLGEGLDGVLSAVVYDPRLKDYVRNPSPVSLMGAGELCCVSEIITVPYVSLRIQVRGARRIQIVLYARNDQSKAWMKKNFGRFGLYPLFRRDADMFIPKCWGGAVGTTSDVNEAVSRAVRMVRLTQLLQHASIRTELDEFADLLTGLPFN